MIKFQKKTYQDKHISDDQWDHNNAKNRRGYHDYNKSGNHLQYALREKLHIVW